MKFNVLNFTEKCEFQKNSHECSSTQQHVIVDTYPGQPVASCQTFINHPTCPNPQGLSPSYKSLYLHPLCIYQVPPLSPYWLPPSMFPWCTFTVGATQFRILHTPLCPVIVGFPLYMSNPSQPIPLQHCADVLNTQPVSQFGWWYSVRLSRNLLLHIHLTILISVRSSVLSSSFIIGHVSLPCSMLLLTALLYTTHSLTQTMVNFLDHVMVMKSWIRLVLFISNTNTLITGRDILYKLSQIYKSLMHFHTWDHNSDASCLYKKWVKVKYWGGEGRNSKWLYLRTPPSSLSQTELMPMHASLPQFYTVREQHYDWQKHCIYWWNNQPSKHSTIYKLFYKNHNHFTAKSPWLELLEKAHLQHTIIIHLSDCSVWWSLQQCSGYAVLTMKSIHDLLTKQHNVQEWHSAVCR